MAPEGGSSQFSASPVYVVMKVDRRAGSDVRGSLTPVQGLADERWATRSWLLRHPALWANAWVFFPNGDRGQPQDVCVWGRAVVRGSATSLPIPLLPMAKVQTEAQSNLIDVGETLDWALVREDLQRLYRWDAHEYSEEGGLRALYCSIAMRPAPARFGTRRAQRRTACQR